MIRSPHRLVLAGLLGRLSYRLLRAVVVAILLAAGVWYLR